MGRYRNGTRSGYSEYRYGEFHGRKGSGRPYLSQRKSIVDGAQRDSLVTKVAEQMRPWTFSRWEHEAGTFLGLRSAFVEAGHPFAASEAEAEDIVRRAFNALGRGVETRPTLIEGQAVYTDGDGHDHCVWCRGELDLEDIAAGRRLCSSDCRAALREHNAELHAWATNAERAAAFYIAAKATMPPRPCDHCGEAFVPKKPGTRFCSATCARHGRDGAVYHAPRPCVRCGTFFKPPNDHQAFCSTDCANAARREAQPERQCDSCGTTFKPGRAETRFCSRKCASRDWAQRKRARERAASIS